MTDTPVAHQDQSTWTKLRDRKVVQWGVLYVAGAWVFLQGLEYISSTFDWPRQIQQLTTLALLMGLPIVSVLAWYHGDRGQQRISTPEFGILTVLLLLGGGAFWYYQRASDAGNKDAATTTDFALEVSPEFKDPRPSIAVLPFENRSRLQDDAFFVAGIHDDILTQVSKISALRVISRISVERFRDTKLPMRTIAGQLGVTKILEGGVQRAGDRVRINVQLIDANTDAHLWAESYDRELTAANIFAIQSELAASIAGALKATLTAAERARIDAIPTQNLEAWEAYQIGKQRMAKRTSGDLGDAERFFNDAISHDPKFALAYSGLADARILQLTYGGASWQTTLGNADNAVAEAMRLNPNLAEAWASSGVIAANRSQPERAEAMYRRAIALNPNYAQAHHWLSLILRESGHHDEELEHAQRAAQLDPLSVISVTNFADSLVTSGRFDEAAARYRRAIEVDPSSPVGYGSLATLEAYARNRFPEAIALQERAIALDAGSPKGYAYLVRFCLDLGDMARAQQLVASTIRRWPTAFFSNLAATVTAELQGIPDAAQSSASRVLAAFPREVNALATLRNADLRRGDLQAARARYASGFPELVARTPRVNARNIIAAIDLALVLQRARELDKAAALLDAVGTALLSLPRLGEMGYGIADVHVHALRGDKTKALTALRAAQQAGWRGPLWRYRRDIDPNLASIRDEPKFKAIFADIERDMVQQRARLAARPKDAPLQSQ